VFTLNCLEFERSAPKIRVFIDPPFLTQPACQLAIMSSKEYKKTTLTGKTTHPLWKRQLEEEIRGSKGKWRHIDGTAQRTLDDIRSVEYEAVADGGGKEDGKKTVRPYTVEENKAWQVLVKQTQEEQDDFDTDFHNLNALIFSSIDDNHKAMVRTLRSPRELWGYLNAMYEGENYAQLLEDFTSLVQTTMMPNLDVNLKVQRLRTYNDLVAGQKEELRMPDVMLAMLLIISMPAEYEGAIDLIKESSEEQTLDMVVRRFREKETRLASLSEEVAKAARIGGYSVQRDTGNSFRSSPGNGRRPQLCYACNEPLNLFPKGHGKQSCAVYLATPEGKAWANTVRGETFLEVIRKTHGDVNKKKEVGRTVRELPYPAQREVVHSAVEVVGREREFSDNDSELEIYSTAFSDTVIPVSTELNRGIYPDISRRDRNRIFRRLQREKSVAVPRHFVSKKIDRYFGWRPTLQPQFNGFYSTSQSVSNQRRRLRRQQDIQTRMNRPDRARPVKEPVAASTDNGWGLDSQASRHICRDKKLFISLQPDSQVVVCANGEEMTAAGRGDIRLHWQDTDDSIHTIKITNVLWIPKADGNLLSLGQLNDNGIEISVTQDGAMHLHKGGRTYMRGFKVQRVWWLKQLNYTPRVFSAKEVVRRAFDRTRNERLHARLGHPGKTHSEQFKAVVDGLKDNLRECFCEACVYAKATRSPGRESLTVETKLLGCVHMDLCGPFAFPSIERKRYMLTITCQASRYVWTFFRANKQDLIQVIKDWKRDAERDCRIYSKSERLLRIHCDRGGEFINNAMKSWCEGEGIKLDPTVGYNPESNGIAERCNRTIIEKANAIRIEAGLSEEFWEWSCETATYLHNRGPVDFLDKKTPWEAWYHKRPSIKHYRVWGCPAYVHVPDEKRKKLQNKAWKGIFIGYTDTTAVYRIYDPNTRNVHECKFVIFDELHSRKTYRQIARSHRARFKKLVEHEGLELVDLSDDGEDTEYNSDDDDQNDQAWDTLTSTTRDQLRVVEKSIPTKEHTAMQGEQACSRSGIASDVIDTIEVPPSPELAQADLNLGDGDSIIGPQGVQDTGERSDSRERSTTVDVIRPQGVQDTGERSDSRERSTTADAIVVDMGSRGTDHFIDQIEDPIRLNTSPTTSKPESKTAKERREREERRTAKAAADAEAIQKRHAEGRARGDRRGRSAQERANKARQQLQLLPDRMYIPKGFDDAMATPLAKDWKACTDEEIRNITKRGTFRSIPKPTNISAKDILHAKLVYDVKYKETLDQLAPPEVRKLKARLVARGDKQTYGINYQETFAPTMGFDAFRLILATAAKHGWKIRQLDVVAAFLAGDLDEYVVMKLPAWLHSQFGEYVQVLKSLYGLKQAGRIWWKLLQGFLESIGFRSTETDETVMIKEELIMENDKGCLIVIGIYVDDMLVTGPNEEENDKVAKQLMGRFEIQDMGEARNVLGIRILRKGGILSIDQSQYAAEMVKEFLYDNGNAVFATPMATNAVTTLATDPGKRLDAAEEHQFLQMLGKCNWLCNTRPDITFAVHKIQQFSAHPCSNHRLALFRVIGYIAGTLDYGIVYSAGRQALVDGVEDINYYTVDHNIEVHVGTSRDTDGGLTAFSDADHAADPVNRKSETGAVGMMCGGAVWFSSTKQKGASQSTTQSEFIALSDTSRKALWARLFLASIEGNPIKWDEEGNSYGTPPVPMLFGDNKAAVLLTQGLSSTSKVRHIDTAYHVITGNVKKGALQVYWIPGKDQLADGFTKPLARPEFEEKRRRIGVRDIRRLMA
jgi:hypothetical protein